MKKPSGIDVDDIETVKELAEATAKAIIEDDLKHCKHCGKAFLPFTGRQKYCGRDECLATREGDYYKRWCKTPSGKAARIRQAEQQKRRRKAKPKGFCL